MRPTGVSGPGEAATLRSELAGSLANVALVLASLLAVLLLGETALRLVHPKYEHLAQATWVRAAEGFMRDPGHRRSRRHPDTGERHEILLNSLGLRQHRDFTAAALQSAVNIGVFGDSFIDNMNMAAEFSFSEPLDYLLNVEREGPATEGNARPSFNVLNFGHGGWGTAESMLRYEQSGLRGRVDHVYYFYTANDVVENVTWALAKGEGYRRPWRFRLDDGGQLEKVEAGFGRAFASALLSKLHLSYLALDATSVFSARLGWLYSDPPPGALPVFRQLLRRFKDGVEGDGASFRLVWLPHREQPDDVAAIVAEEGVASVSLMDCFAEHDPAHLRTPWGRSPYRFKNDPHWNEAGNRLAAMCLNRFLERQLGLPALSDEAVESALGRYYAAFEAPPAAGRPADLAAAAIRTRYAPLLGRSRKDGADAAHRPGGAARHPLHLQRLPARWAGCPMSSRGATGRTSTRSSSCMWCRPTARNCRRTGWRTASTTWTSAGTPTHPARCGRNCPATRWSASGRDNTWVMATASTKCCGRGSMSLAEGGPSPVPAVIDV